MSTGCPRCRFGQLRRRARLRYAAAPLRGYGWCVEGLLPPQVHAYRGASAPFFASLLSQRRWASAPPARVTPATRGEEACTGSPGVARGAWRPVRGPDARTQPAHERRGPRPVRPTSPRTASEARRETTPPHAVEPTRRRLQEHVLPPAPAHVPPPGAAPIAPVLTQMEGRRLRPPGPHLARAPCGERRRLPRPFRARRLSGCLPSMTRR